MFQLINCFPKIKTKYKVLFKVSFYVDIPLQNVLKTLFLYIETKVKAKLVYQCYNKISKKYSLNMDI